jgi:Protein of unknown function (DUF2442)
MKPEVEFIPYGEISSELTKDRWRRTSRHVRISNIQESTKEAPHRVFIAFSQNLDESFVEWFRNWATQETRLLIFNEDLSTDRLLTKILPLQIRKPERCYIVDGRFGAGKSQTSLYTFLERLSATLESNEVQDRIFDAIIEKDILRVVSPRFVRLEVPISQIPQFKNANPAQVLNFEIDEDGSFIYWPDLDVHLGWSQLQQLINPEAALKASQKSEQFNKRYGKAVQKLREATGLRRSNIPGLSEKQLGRIEKGDCRLTSNAIEALSKAHKTDRNEYMKKLAQTLE